VTLNEAKLVQQFLGQLLIQEQHRPIQDVLIGPHPTATGSHIVIVMEKVIENGITRQDVVKQHRITTLGDLAVVLDGMFNT
jgi:hypothetical protein